MHFRLSELGGKPDAEDILSTLRPALEQCAYTVYLFQDGDIVVTWNGAQNAVYQDVRKRLYARFAPKAAETGLDSYYDMQAHNKQKILDSIQCLVQERQQHT